MKHIINLEAKPKVPYDGWTVESHIGKGKIDLSKVKLELHLDEEQKIGYIVGNKLREKLGDNVLNANVLDYLLEHTELIPDEWKGKYIYFWGTIYRYSDGNLCVRYLYFNEGHWQADGRWLSSDWGSDEPAARLAIGTKVSKPQNSLELSAAIELVKGAGYQVSKIL